MEAEEIINNIHKERSLEYIRLCNWLQKEHLGIWVKWIEELNKNAH